MKNNFKAIATKTMIASAIASLMAGTALATPTWEAVPTGSDVYSKTNASGSIAELKDKNVFTLNDETTTARLPFIAPTDSTFCLKENQSLWVVATGDSNAVKATGIWAKGVTATNEGTIYVTAEGKAPSWAQAAMKSAEGGTVTNKGTIVVKNAYGMGFGTNDVNSSTASTISNEGTIVVLENGTGFDIGGTNGTQNKATNTGSIVATGKAYGVLVDQKGGVFTNDKNGFVSAESDGAAILVDAGSSSVNLKDGSTVNGLITTTSNVTDIAYINIENGAAVNGDLELYGSTAVVGESEGAFINGTIYAYGGTNAQTINGADGSIGFNALVVGRTDDTSTTADESIKSQNVNIAGDVTVEKVSVNNGTLKVLRGDTEGDALTSQNVEVAAGGVIDFQGGQSNIETLTQNGTATVTGGDVTITTLNIANLSFASFYTKNPSR